jgi:type VI secretion system secreted protein Hcp
MPLDMFLKIDGIPGESQDSKHKNEIDVESFSFGLSNAGSAVARGGAKVSVQDFNFVMKVNKASPKLFISCATGEQIRQAILTARKEGGQDPGDFLIVTMTDLLVSSYQTGGDASSDVVPTDQVSFNYSKIEFEYREQKADGSLGDAVKVGYDVKANKKV